MKNNRLSKRWRRKKIRIDIYIYDFFWIHTFICMMHDAYLFAYSSLTLTQPHKFSFSVFLMLFKHRTKCLLESKNEKEDEEEEKKIYVKNGISTNRIVAFWRSVHITTYNMHVWMVICHCVWRGRFSIIFSSLFVWFCV